VTATAEPSDTYRLPTYLRGFGRITTSDRFLPVVDGLRFVAIMMVVLYHLNDHLVRTVGGSRESLMFQVLNVGNGGVQLFFVLSGFILGLPFIEAGLGRRPPVRLKPYLLRRVTRLEPPYAVNLLIAFGLLVMVKGASAAELFPHLAASLVYAHNQVYGQISAVNGVAWSLEIEVQFYLLAPALAAVFLRGPRVRRRLVLATAIAGIITAKVCATTPVDPRIWLSFLYWADLFLIGFLVADVYARDWDSAPRPSRLWDAISLFTWPAIIACQWDLRTYHLIGPLAGLAYAGAFRGRSFGWLFTRPVVVVVGGMCYSVYLYHFYVISLIGRHVAKITDGLSYHSTLCWYVVVVVPATLILCAAPYRMFERPFMRWTPWKPPRRE